MCLQWLDSLPPQVREKKLKETMGEFLNTIQSATPIFRSVVSPQSIISWLLSDGLKGGVGADLMAEKVLAPPPPSKLFCASPA